VYLQTYRRPGRKTRKAGIEHHLGKGNGGEINPPRCILRWGLLCNSPLGSGYADVLLHLRGDGQGEPTPVNRERRGCLTRSICGVSRSPGKESASWGSSIGHRVRRFGCWQRARHHPGPSLPGNGRQSIYGRHTVCPYQKKKG